MLEGNFFKTRYRLCNQTMNLRKVLPQEDLCHFSIAGDKVTGHVGNSELVLSLKMKSKTCAGQGLLCQWSVSISMSTKKAIVQCQCFCSFSGLVSCSDLRDGLPEVGLLLLLVFIRLFVLLKQGFVSGLSSSQVRILLQSK